MGKAGTPGAITFGLILLAMGFTWPIWQHPTWWGIHDWPQFYAWYEVPRLTLLKYHQFPLWNPYLAGGAPELGHTHSPFLSPFFLPVLLWGPVVGLKLCVMLYLVVGMSGMMALTQYLECHPLTCLLAAGLWGFNGHMAAHAAVGHTDHLPLFLLPWIVLSLLQQRIFRTSILLVLLFLSGGPYPFLLSVWFLMVLTLGTALVKHSWQPFKNLFTIGGVTFCLGAVKFLPCFEFFLRAVPIPPDFSGCDLSTLKAALVSSRWIMEANVRDGLGSWEYSATIGWCALGVGALSLSGLNVEGFLFLIPGVIGLLLACGREDPLRLFWAIQRLPLLRAFHVPFRWIALCIFSLALVIAVGLSRWIARFPRIKPVIGLLGLCMLGELLLVNQTKWSGIFTVPAPQHVSSGEFRQIRTGFSMKALSPEDLVEEPFHRRMFLALLQGHGIVDTYDPLRLPLKAQAMGDPGYQGEVYLQKGSGRAMLERWSPNRLQIGVEARQADHLVINQNFYPGWVVLQGPIRKTVPVDGLIGVPVPKGNWQIVLIYLPLSVLVGAGISGLTLIILGWRWRATRRTASTI